ncbi:MAG: oligopeptide transporter, OPT family [Verrucomicrobiales bacterium]|nr:oligopeptide transporter, OPT family [Verrucomicrobiales bacterium]
MGTLLGMIFGASSLYLVLKVGLTVSASIPVAVISITLFRLGSRLFGMRNATVLENNIVQTAGSAGESIAFGVGVTMPAIMILGFDLETTRVMLVAILGGLLGILMMIPLRRALIVQQHGILKYPEGTACGEVLKAGADDVSLAAAAGAVSTGGTAVVASALASGARVIFTGFGIGLVYNTLMKAFRGWRDSPDRAFGPPFNGASVGIEITPELLGVGYIIGPRIASIMFSGGVLAYLVLIPAIKFFGEGLTQVLAPGGRLISEMGPGEIRNAYVLYIGAGAVAAGGIISVLRSLPLIWQGIRGGLRDYSNRRGPASGVVPRTERDLSMRFVVGGIVALLVMIMVAKPLHMNLLGAMLIVLFGFLFVTVSSRLTGEIGSSSNPISGMTVATLLLTCLIFLLLGWTGPTYFVTALSIGGIVCIASSNGGTTSQDLKSGFLVGATPRLQQIAILIGALASALVLGPILLTLNQAGTVYVPVAQVASGLATDPAALTERQVLAGPQAKQDTKQYRVWHKTDTTGGPPGKYLVDDAGKAVWLVDPGINGSHRMRPDGTEAQKFEAPKATLMSYIIKGILNRELPWHLVLLGVMIAVVLELAGIPSLAFAVGVYLPLAASAPIFVGGAIRWLGDRHLRVKSQGRELTEEELVAEGDRSPGVLLASGYIAGGAIAGILIAFLEGMFSEVSARLDAWSTRNNPFFSLEPFEEGRGLYALGEWLQRMHLFSPHLPDVLSLLPFVFLVVLLWRVATERSMTGGRRRAGSSEA